MASDNTGLNFVGGWVLLITLLQLLRLSLFHGSIEYQIVIRTVEPHENAREHYEYGRIFQCYAKGQL